MEPLVERYTRYLEAKEGDIELCEFFTFDEYNMLYEEGGYNKLDTTGKKVLKYGGAYVGAGVATSLAGIGGGPVGAIIGLLVIALLKAYRVLKDKCRVQCKNVEEGPKRTICEAKCNIGAANIMLKEVEVKRKIALSKTKNDKQKEAVNKKFDKKVEFFKNKITEFKAQIQRAQGSMKATG
jgi:hypothetical protein